MYSWGSDTSTWKNPGAYDFGSAKKAYYDTLEEKAKTKGPKTYYEKAKPSLDVVGSDKDISSMSKNPIHIAIDGTGSMQTIPAAFFDRAPLLYQTLSKYQDDLQISFSVIGDATSDEWPLQVTEFSEGLVLEDYLNALHAEGGGGPGIRESYELWAYYMTRHVSTPEAEKPLLFLIGDEKFYDQVDVAQVSAYIGDTLQANLDAKEVMKELTNKFSVFMLRKEYLSRDAEVKTQWEEVLGQQRIIPIFDYDRVVDQIMGKIAKMWGNYGDFKTNMSARQDSETIAVVDASLRLAPIGDKVEGLKSSLVTNKLGEKSTNLLMEDE